MAFFGRDLVKQAFQRGGEMVGYFPFEGGGYFLNFLSLNVTARKEGMKRLSKTTVTFSEN